MNNKTFTKTYASTIAPNPEMNVVWMDLSADPYGSILKVWNGKKWNSILDVIDYDNAHIVNVYGNGTASENGIELTNAISKAKSLSLANGTNSSPVVILISPGEYTSANTKFGFYIDFGNVILKSKTGEDDKSVKLSNLTINNAWTSLPVSAIGIYAPVFCIESAHESNKFINCRSELNGFQSDPANELSDAAICRGIFYNCHADGYSFGLDSTSVNSMFVNCSSGDCSFGGYLSSGTFIDCKAGSYSFGGNGMGVASGKYTRCIGEQSCFGGDSGGIASGEFYSCTGDNNCFGHPNGGNSSGRFFDCIATYGSFCGDVVSGVYKNCKAAQSSFCSTVSNIGIFENCIADDYSFLSTNPCGGRIINCIAGTNSFSNTGIVCAGCVAGYGSFCSDTMVGVSLVLNCISDGDYSFISSGDWNSIEYVNCIGSGYSFILNGDVSSILKGCALSYSQSRFDTATISGNGKIIGCIDSYGVTTKLV